MKTFIVHTSMHFFFKNQIICEIMHAAEKYLLGLMGSNWQKKLQIMESSKIFVFFQ